MKQFIIQAIFAALISSVIFSCEFEPSSENFIEVAKPDTTRQISVNLSPFETQYVFTKVVNVNYDLNTFGLKIYNVEFFVGNQSIHKGTEAKGFFGFNPGLYGRGMKEMTMQITTNANTGSLADRLGVEALVYQQTWKVVVDGEAPDPVEIKRIFNDNGVLKLEWEAYTRINFEQYKVYRKFGKIGDQAETHQIASFTDPKQVSVYDYSYIGGNSTYWVVVEGSDQSSISTKKEISYPEPRLDTVWMRSDSAKFIWRKNQFYNAIKKVEISIPEAYSKPRAVLFSTENANDTTVTISNLRFGNSVKHTLSSYAKTQIGLFDDKQILKYDLNLVVGKKFPKWNRLIGSPTENHLYLWNSETISKLNMDTKAIVSSVNQGYFYQWFFSEYDGNLYACNHNLIKFNKNNLSDTKTYNPVDFGIHDFWTTTSISSDNRIAGPIGLYIGYYDLSEKRLVFTEKNTNIGWCTFSPDGKFAFQYIYDYSPNKGSIVIYEVSDTGLKEYTIIPPNNYTKYFWIPGKEHQLMLLNGYEDDYVGGWTENTISIFDAKTIKNILNFKVKVGVFTNIDVYSKQIAIWDENPNSDEKRKLYVYNYETGSLMKEINLIPSIDGLFIFNSNLISSEGYCFNYLN